MKNGLARHTYPRATYPFVAEDSAMRIWYSSDPRSSGEYTSRRTQRIERKRVRREMHYRAPPSEPIIEVLVLKVGKKRMIYRKNGV